MQGVLEQALPFVAAWGVWVLVAVLAASVLAIGWLGRGSRLLIPARWPGRIAALGFLGLATLSGVGLFGITGPLRPMMDQVRSIQRSVGRPAGEVAFRGVTDDSPGTLGGLRGKVVLVNLWATWCPPCRKELPDIDRLQRTYADRGLVVVTLSNEERERLRKFAAEHPLGTLNVYATELGWLDVDGRPLSVLIDRDGIVREYMIGDRTFAEFEATVTRYLPATS
jgi:thiol-disulfide isomerase/thioredoxin